MKTDRSTPMEAEAGAARAAEGAASAPAAPAKKPRPLWQSLKEDASFRTTFIGVFVIPAVLMAVTIAWIVRAMALH